MTANKAIVCIFVLIGVAYLFYNKGYEAAEGRYAIDALQQAGETALANQVLHSHIAQLDNKHTKELLDAQETIDDVLNNVRSGERRLFVKTKAPSCAVSNDSKTASVDYAAAKSELDPDTSELIINLTARGDKAIIQLTACQEFINQINKDLN